MTIQQVSLFETTTTTTESFTPETMLYFRENAASMDDKSLLSFLLTFTSTRKREELADALLDSFGSLRGVLEARPEQLASVDGCTRKTADLLASFLPVTRALTRRMQDKPEQLRNASAASAYCKSLLQGERLESFWVVSLNAQCQVLGARKISTGSLSEVSAYPRLVMETALNYNAHSVLLTHNHPGGTCAPSPEDISSTLQLQKLLNGVGILVLDHIIVANDNTYSMLDHGDIRY